MKSMKKQNVLNPVITCRKQARDYARWRRDFDNKPKNEDEAFWSAREREYELNNYVPKRWRQVIDTAWKLESRRKLAWCLSIINNNGDRDYSVAYQENFAPQAVRIGMFYEGMYYSKREAENAGRHFVRWGYTL